MAETLHFSAGGALLACLSLVLLGSGLACSEQSEFCPDASMNDNVAVESVSLLQHALQVDKVKAHKAIESHGPQLHRIKKKRVNTIAHIQKRLAKATAKERPFNHQSVDDVPMATSGCTCNKLRMLWHDYAMNNHVACLHGINCTYSDVTQADWQLLAAAANMHYSSSCDGVVNENCGSDEAQAIFYKKKQELVENPDDKLEDELIHVLYGTDAGCSCDPASIAMHRVWKAGGYFPEASEAYLEFCNDTPNTECSCDPLEAGFHFLAAKAHTLSERTTMGVENEVPLAGHRAYVKYCSGASMPGHGDVQKLLEDLQ